MAFDIVLIIGFCIKIQKLAACNNTMWKNQIFHLNEKYTRFKFRHKLKCVFAGLFDDSARCMTVISKSNRQ